MLKYELSLVTHRLGDKFILNLNLIEFVFAFEFEATCAPEVRAEVVSIESLEQLIHLVWPSVAKKFANYIKENGYCKGWVVLHETIIPTHCIVFHRKQFIGIYHAKSSLQTQCNWKAGRLSHVQFAGSFQSDQLTVRLHLQVAFSCLANGVRELISNLVQTFIMVLRRCDEVLGTPRRIPAVSWPLIGRAVADKPLIRLKLNLVGQFINNLLT